MRSFPQDDFSQGCPPEMDWGQYQALLRAQQEADAKQAAAEIANIEKSMTGKLREAESLNFGARKAEMLAGRADARANATSKLIGQIQGALLQLGTNYQDAYRDGDVDAAAAIAREAQRLQALEQAKVSEYYQLVAEKEKQLQDEAAKAEAARQAMHQADLLKMRRGR